MLEVIKKDCEGKATLVCVSKMRTIDELEKVYQRGLRDFGENKVQELLAKYQFHDDVNWHFVGRLQTNKVKDVVRTCTLIHSVDRYDLIKAIDKEAAKQNKVMPCLIQFNIADEETKAGFMISEEAQVFEELQNYPNIKVEGIMCIGPHVEDEAAIKAVFMQGKELFDAWRERQTNSMDIKYLSMGMSKDYKIALDSGATIVRVGKAIFEEV